jgi:hypothetical protein
MAPAQDYLQWKALLVNQRPVYYFLFNNAEDNKVWFSNSALLF